MKPKHVAARVAQCLAIAACSPCPRRKCGCVLLDPASNVVLVDAYNGAPRGGGELCGGDRCERDGIDSADVTIGSEGPGLDYVYARYPVRAPRRGSMGKWYCGSRAAAEALRAEILAMNAPIESGTRCEVGCYHAEMNTVANAARLGVCIEGAWAVVSMEPCLLCAKLLYHAGIARVLCVGGGFIGSAAAPAEAGPEFLRSRGIPVDYVEGPRDPRAGLSRQEGA